MRILSYNILANRYYEGKMGWPERLEMIKRKLYTVADIICLQGVELNDVDGELGAFLNQLGYRYVRHTVDKNRTNPIGNLTAWKGLNYAKHKTNSSAVVVWFDNLVLANVHLKAGIYTHSEVRNSQLRSIMRYNPDVIVGDFNDDFVINPAPNGYHRSESTLTVFTKDIEPCFWAFDHCFSKWPVHTNAEMIYGPIPDNIEPSDHIPVLFDISLT